MTRAALSPGPGSRWPSWARLGVLGALVVGSVAACPRPVAPDGGARPDAGAPPRDAGVDGGPSGGEGDAGPAPDAGPTDAGFGGTCDDDDPLTWTGWVGFCDDRVDDNCTVDAPEDPCPFTVSVHHPCQTGDEPCPATLPAHSAPSWDCQGARPRSVLAWAVLEEPTPQIASACFFIYRGGPAGDEWLAAVDVENGPDLGGPDAACAVDFIYRHHLWLSDLDGDEPCEPVTVGFPSSADDFRVSNRCRKAIRPIELDDPQFEPDVQYFAASEAEARAKLAILETVEIGCLRAVDGDGNELRPWVVQLALPVTVAP